MLLRRFVATQSLIWIVMAALLLIIPRQFVGWFGPVLDSGSVVLARVFAAELTALAFVSYFETSKHWPAFPRMAWLAYTLSNSVAFIVTLSAVRSGAFNVRGWLIVAAYFLYAAVFIIVLIRNPRENA
jgi:hypothetical protein